MKVTLCDVAGRDGLQSDPKVLPPTVRAELANRLSTTGLHRIEPVSFVHPKRVPQMAGAEEVVDLIRPAPGVRYVGLVLNDRGYDRLRTTWLDEVHGAIAATESFNRRNQNAAVEGTFAAVKHILARAHNDGIKATVGIAVAFGCPFEGPVDPGRVVKTASELVEAGADEIMLADTIGVAVPRQIRDLVGRVVGLGVPIGLHLHDTRNTGVANAYAGVEAGATVLDASVGGVGGCPFAPRATGNVATEDLLYMLDGEGVETGVGLDELISVAHWLEGVLGRQLPGQVYRAGPFVPVPVEAA